MAVKVDPEIRREIDRYMKMVKPKRGWWWFRLRLREHMLEAAVIPFDQIPLYLYHDSMVFRHIARYRLKIGR